MLLHMPSAFFFLSLSPLLFLRLLMCLGDNIWRWSCFLNGMKPSRHCCWRVLWPRLFHISEILALKLLLYVISERLFPIWWIAAAFSWWGCCGPAARCAASLSEDLVGLHVVGGANTDCTSLSAPRPWPSVCMRGQLLRPASRGDKEGRRVLEHRDSTALNPVKLFEIALGRPPLDKVTVLNLWSYKSLVGQNFDTTIQQVGDPSDGTKPLLRRIRLQ